MIDLKKERLQAARNLGERLFVKVVSRPQYSCRNVSDFIHCQYQIPHRSRVKLPPVYYFPNEELRINTTGAASLSLRDTSGEIDISVDPNERNLFGNRLVIACLRDIEGGDMIYSPILTNRRVYEKSTFYLSGFEAFKKFDGQGEQPSLASRFTSLFLHPQPVLAN